MKSLEIQITTYQIRIFELWMAAILRFLSKSEIFYMTFLQYNTELHNICFTLKVMQPPFIFDLNKKSGIQEAVQIV